MPQLEASYGISGQSPYDRYEQSASSLADRRLIVSIDLGTTFSGVSYCILDDKTPVVRSVKRFPGNDAGSAKVPTVLLYDADGVMRAAGAEALLPDTVEQAEDEGWTKVEWFKIRLHPDSMPSQLRRRQESLPPLPAGKDVITLFADFYSYLFSCATQFIQETHPYLKANWNELRANATFVLTHPNSWDGRQQSLMRKAAIAGGLVQGTQRGKSKIIFVQEGEASLHFCVRNGFLDNSKRAFVVADLGGGTLDFSSYVALGYSPLRVSETAATKCELEGSVMVTQRAFVGIKRKLEGSSFEKDVELISEKFDKSAKLTFSDPSSVPRVQFGRFSDNDPSRDVERGKLKLNGGDVAGYFEPSIAASVKAISSFVASAPVPVSSVYLVGGFAASPYLKSELRKRIRTVSLNNPDDQNAKAAADGAIYFYIDHFVNSRVAKVTYGLRFDPYYDATNPSHVRRKQYIHKTDIGEEILTGHYHIFVKKGSAISEETEYRWRGQKTFRKGNRYTVSCPIIAYRGDGEPPEWVDEAKRRDDFKVLCQVVTDYSEMPPTYSTMAQDGTLCNTYVCDIVFLFGGPELKAQLAWVENGIEKRGPLEIAYDEA